MYDPSRSLGKIMRSNLKQGEIQMKKLVRPLLFVFVILSFVLAACGTPTATEAPVVEATEAPVAEATKAPVTETTEVSVTEATLTPQPTPQDKCAFATHAFTKVQVIGNGFAAFAGAEVSYVQTFTDFGFTLRPTETKGDFLARFDPNVVRPVFVQNVGTEALTTTENEMFVQLLKVAPGLATGANKDTAYTGKNVVVSSIATEKCGTDPITLSVHASTVIAALQLNVEPMTPWVFTVNNGVYTLVSSPPQNE